MGDTSTTTTSSRTRLESTAIVHVAVASYLAEHHLNADSIRIPRHPGRRFEIWIHDIDVETWLAAGARMAGHDVRPVTAAPGTFAVTAVTEVDTALGVVAVDVSWLEQRAHLEAVPQ